MKWFETKLFYSKKKKKSQVDTVNRAKRIVSMILSYVIIILILILILKSKVIWNIKEKYLLTDLMQTVIFT